jgi:hypothetical protein
VTELEGHLRSLTQSYKSLQLEYSTVKQELETLRQGHCKHGGTSPVTRSDMGQWEEFCVGSYDLANLDVLTPCYDVLTPCYK